MNELLTKLYNSLSDAFQENLKREDIYRFDDDSIDVFKTLISLKKNFKELNKLMIQGAVSIDELEYDFGKEDLCKCLDNNYIIKGYSINSNKVFIGTNGLFKLNTNNLKDIFIAYDSKNFILDKKLELVSQEKIWCIFLLLFGADNIENRFNTGGLSTEKLKDYHNFFKSIDKEMKNRDINLGNKIGWDSGKNNVFRKFITNNKDLPKTSIYFKKGQYEYYLDLSKRKNSKYLLDLILEGYIGENRLIANENFYHAIKELELKISIELGDIPGTINKYIIEELRG